MYRLPQIHRRKSAAGRPTRRRESPSYHWHRDHKVYRRHDAGQRALRSIPAHSPGRHPSVRKECTRASALLNRNKQVEPIAFRTRNDCHLGAGGLAVSSYPIDNCLVWRADDAGNATLRKNFFNIHDGHSACPIRRISQRNHKQELSCRIALRYRLKIARRPQAKPASSVRYCGKTLRAGNAAAGSKGRICQILGILQRTDELKWDDRYV